MKKETLWAPVGVIAGATPPLLLLVMTGWLLVSSGWSRFLSASKYFDALFFQYNLLILNVAVLLLPFLAFTYVVVMKNEKRRRLYRELGDRWSECEQKIDEYLASQFQTRNYVVSVTAMMTVCSFGAVLLLLAKPVYAAGQAGVDFTLGGNLLLLGPFIEDAPSAGHYHFMFHSLTAIGFGFLGAYVYSISQLIRSYFTVDLTPNMFIASTIRIVVASVLALVCSFAIEFMVPEKQFIHEEALTILPVIGFFLGYFPARALRAIERVVNRVMGKFVQEEEYGSTALSKISGMNVTHAARLEREGYDNVENLASGEPLELAIRTGFPYSQLKEWVGEARLRIHLGSDFETFVDRTGIRTHEQFCEFFHNYVQKQRSEPATEFLAKAAKLDIAAKLETVLLLSNIIRAPGQRDRVVGPRTMDIPTPALTIRAEPR